MQLSFSHFSHCTVLGKNKKRDESEKKRAIRWVSSRISTAPLCSAGKREGVCWGCPEVRGGIPAPCQTCGSRGSWRMQEGWQGGLSALSSMFPRKPSTANITLVLPCGPAHVMSRTISHNSAQKVSKTWWNVQWLWPGFPAGNKTRDWECLHCFGALWQIPNQTFYYFYSNLMVCFPHRFAVSPSCCVYSQGTSFSKRKRREMEKPAVSWKALEHLDQRSACALIIKAPS